MILPSVFLSLPSPGAIGNSSREILHPIEVYSDYFFVFCFCFLMQPTCTAHMSRVQKRYRTLAAKSATDRRTCQVTALPSRPIIKMGGWTPAPCNAGHVGRPGEMTHFFLVEKRQYLVGPPRHACPQKVNKVFDDALPMFPRLSIALSRGMGEMRRH